MCTYHLGKLNHLIKLQHKWAKWVIFGQNGVISAMVWPKSPFPLCDFDFNFLQGKDFGPNGPRHWVIGLNFIQRMDFGPIGPRHWHFNPSIRFWSPQNRNPYASLILKTEFPLVGYSLYFLIYFFDLWWLWMLVMPRF